MKTYHQLANEATALSDAQKVNLIGHLLEGGFDDEDIADALSDTIDAYAEAYKGIQNILDDQTADPTEDYDGGRFDWETSRGCARGLRI